MMQQLFQESTQLLKNLIQTPSFSKEEEQTADLIQDFFAKKEIPISRKGNNIWAKSTFWDDQKPTILLNSHHDTVKVARGWTKNPFGAEVVNGQLFGLGSNDAGGCLVSLLACFLHFREMQNLQFNLIFATSAEEEISGKNGIASIIPDLGNIDLAIVGEPTQMQMAIAEKGLMVVDGMATGKSGHAARNEGINALYLALDDINQLRATSFEKVSDLLGAVKVSITQIQAGQQHNVVPDQCKFVVDVRTNECYSNEEAFELLQSKVQSKLKARSFRLNSSGIPLEHPFVQTGIGLGLSYYGSPTLSDQALMPFTSIKIGPGDSARSHTADEFIYLSEIEAGIKGYITLLTNYNQKLG